MYLVFPVLAAKVHTHTHTHTHAHAQGYTADDMEFQTRITMRSGLGDDTYCPPCEARGAAVGSCGRGLPEALDACPGRCRGGAARAWRPWRRAWHRLVAALRLPASGRTPWVGCTPLHAPGPAGLAPPHPPPSTPCSKHLPGLAGHPFFFDMAHSRLEFEVVCFSAVEELLARTGVKPGQARGGEKNLRGVERPPCPSAHLPNQPGALPPPNRWAPSS